MDLKKLSRVTDSFQRATRVQDTEHEVWYERIAKFLDVDHELDEIHDTTYVFFYGDEDKLKQIANIFPNPPKVKDGTLQIELFSFDEEPDYTFENERVDEFIESHTPSDSVNRVKDSDDSDVRDILSSNDKQSLVSALKKRFPEIAERLDSEFEDILREATLESKARKSRMASQEQVYQDKNLLKEIYPDAAFVNYYKREYTVQVVANSKEECLSQIKEWAERIPEGFVQVHAKDPLVIVEDPHKGNYRGYLQLKKK
jgi:hypothetical protein